MHLRLHKNATTTPRIRAEIQVSKEPMRVLAQRFGVSVCTIARWKKRASVHDASHTPHRLQTTLTPAQESIVLVLRKSLGLSLDDLLAVVREFIHPTISRAALHRMLKRHGVSAREALSVDRPRTKPLKAYEPGFVHIDVKYLPQMADETTRRYLFVAIDRATRWVFVRVYASKSATNARRFLKELHKAAAFRIRTILTDNGKEFTDRFITRGERTPTGRHQFDQLCEELGIEHRLTRPKHPQTNGMVERFNGRIADILRTHHFHCGEELEATILRYVWLYNHQLPQKALGHVSPIQAMKQWQRSHPELFNRRVTNQPGHDKALKFLDQVQLELGAEPRTEFESDILVGIGAAATPSFGIEAIGGPRNSDSVVRWVAAHRRRRYHPMSKTKRTRYSAEFKAKVALEAIKGEQTISELGSRYGLHPNMITNWKRQAIDNMAEAFSSKAEKARTADDAQIKDLHAKIGQLTVERDFLAKAFGR